MIYFKTVSKVVIFFKNTILSMKIKLFFLLVIVFFAGCAKKTYNGTDHSYFKEEMAKARKQQGEKSVPLSAQALGKGGDNAILTKEEKLKFAGLLGISAENIKNEKLYHSINQWLGVPYLWGGTSKNGIDCSAFVQQIYEKVYEHKLPRTSIEQFYTDTKAHFKDQQYLKEGDLVFFRLRHKDKVVSHVGIYLQNGKFLGSNSPKGVEIVDLNDRYWQDKYVASARLLDN